MRNDACMRLVSFLDPAGKNSWGRVDGTTVVDLGALQPSVRALLAAGALDSAGTHSGPSHSLDAVTLLPPVTDPARILCAGINYDEHRKETGRDANAYPTIFTRYPSSLVGHGVPLVRPTESDNFDYEGELAVIIGRTTRRISVADALGCIAGYACFNDGSVRDWQRKSSQFIPGKNFDSSGSMGPWMVTADEIADPQALSLQTVLDGQVVQSTTTDLMIFNIAELISFCSTFTTLDPGDVIVTGTPGGVGAARKPPLWIKVGSTVTVEISGIGVLSNGCVEG